MGGIIRVHNFFASRLKVQPGRTSQWEEHDESQVQTSWKIRTWWITSKDHEERKGVERHSEQSKGLKIKRKRKI